MPPEGFTVRCRAGSQWHAMARDLIVPGLLRFVVWPQKQRLSFFLMSAVDDACRLVAQGRSGVGGPMRYNALGTPFYLIPAAVGNVRPEN